MHACSWLRAASRDLLWYGLTWTHADFISFDWSTLANARYRQWQLGWAMPASMRLRVHAPNIEQGPLTSTRHGQHILPPSFLLQQHILDAYVYSATHSHHHNIHHTVCDLWFDALRTIADGTCGFPDNFLGCEELSFNQKGTKFIAEDIKLECEVRQPCNFMLPLPIEEHITCTAACMHTLVCAAWTTNLACVRRWSTQYSPLNATLWMAACFSCNSSIPFVV